MLNYYSWWVGGGWLGQKKTKLMLYSTFVEIEVEVEVEHGNNTISIQGDAHITYYIHTMVLYILHQHKDVAHITSTH